MILSRTRISGPRENLASRYHRKHTHAHSMNRPPIMVIDDERAARQLLVRALDRLGFEGVAASGAMEALELIEQQTPAMIVSDYEMPGYNGADVCRFIRGHQDPEVAELPLILLTAHTGEEHEVECLQAGANDFVSKPVNLAILKARIDTHLRLHALREQLENKNAELELWRHRHEMDLEAAQITQEAILPNRIPQIEGWDVASRFQPVIQVGGDIYDWQRLADKSWLFWIADATGHGASAALLTTLTKLVFRHATQERGSNPCDILCAANSDFFSILRGKSFMTAACLVLRPEENRFSIAGAGQPPALIRRKNGVVESIRSHAPPMGIVRDLSCKSFSAEMESGDIALLYTDGLYSTISPEGLRRGPEWVETILPERFDSADDFLEQAMQRLVESTDDIVPDDVAVIALHKL